MVDDKKRRFELGKNTYDVILKKKKTEIFDTIRRVIIQPYNDWNNPELRHTENEARIMGSIGRSPSFFLLTSTAGVHKMRLPRRHSLYHYLTLL